MTKGINVKQPLTVASVGGFFKPTLDVKESVAQNLKFLVLTTPGERIRDPNFGVGLRAYIFENYTPAIENIIRQNIINQANIYMPYITIESVDFDASKIESNQLSLTIKYFTSGTTPFEDFLSLEVTI